MRRLGDPRIARGRTAVVPRVLPGSLTAGTGHGVALLGALALCPLATLVIGNDAEEPIARARALMAVERVLGISVEPAVHAWTLHHPDLMAVAGAFYVFAHVPVAGWALVWTWFLRRDRFRLVRDTFLWTQLVLVTLYVLVPTAPPRLVPDAGYTDTLTTLWGREFAESTHVLQSPFAAVPSGHVAFALVAGGVFATLGDRGWLRAFGWLYPPLVVAVTVATGNHLLLDAAAAIVVVGCAAALAAGSNRRTVTRDAARRMGRVVLDDGRA